MPKKYTRGSGNIHPVDAYVGAKLRAFREERGVSQQTLGERIGLSFQQVQKYERGRNRIAPSTLWEVSQALDVSPADFFRDYQPEAEKQPLPFGPSSEAGILLKLYSTLEPQSQEFVKAELAKMISNDTQRTNG